jgi:hypothetical protein
MALTIADLIDHFEDHRAEARVAAKRLRAALPSRADEERVQQAGAARLAEHEAAIAFSGEAIELLKGLEV